MPDAPNRAAREAAAEVLRREGFPFDRQPMPVECSICEWRGRRKQARGKPCPQCGSKVQYR